MSSDANNWVESYLDALLNAGLSTEHAGKLDSTRGQLVDADRQICAKYYVQQILDLDEDGIQQAWSKVSSHKSSALVHEKDARLAYLSWRVWGMKRRKATVQAEVAKSVTAEPPLEAVPEFSQSELEDDEYHNAPLSDNTPLESEDGEEPVETFQLIPAWDELLGNDSMAKKYVVLISLHGLVRGEKMELGRDPDTGGQVKYVVELAKALSRHPGVHRVDLLTRLILDPKVDSSYGQPEECIQPGDGDTGGAYIVRIPCGPSKTYLRKELLWPHVREFADRAVVYIKGKVADMAQECRAPSVIHGHYADAGEAAALISHTLGVDMVLTGHSLGRNKLEHLLKSGTMSPQEIEASYAISRRIEGEERSLDAALVVFTSTAQEIKDQWGLYAGYNAKLAHVVHARRSRGRCFPLMRVIPPGLDFSNLKIESPPDLFADAANALAVSGGGGGGSNRRSASTTPRVSQSGGGTGPAITPRGSLSGSAAQAGPPIPPPARISTSGGGGGPRLSGSNVPTGAEGSPDGDSGAFSPRSSAPRGPELAMAILGAEDPPLWREVFRFLRNPRKPVILAMSRPDAKKNIAALVRAYGESSLLRELANLVLIMGNRDIIDSLAGGSAKVLEQVLKLIDAYDLYGSVAYPKHHKQSDISDIYLLAAATGGVFVNIALQEPFGLTLIEAAAHGVPIVATKNGGPVDIIATLRNGIIVDPTKPPAIAEALLQLLTSKERWEECSYNGRTLITAYSWPSHCIRYLQHITAAQEQASVPARASDLAPALSASLDMKYAGLPKDGDAPAGSDEALNLTEVSVNSSLTGTRTMYARSFTAESSLIDSVVASLSQMTGLAGKGKTRDQYLVLALDSIVGLTVMRTALANEGGLRALAGAAEGESVGLIVASLYPHDATMKLLRANGVQPTAADYLLLCGGAEVWRSVGGGKFVQDPVYESHAEFRWDKLTAYRVLAQNMTTRVLYGNSPPPKDGRPRVSVDRDLGPQHLLFNVTKSQVSANEEAAMLGRLQTTIRRSGVRAALTLQLDESVKVRPPMKAMVRVHVTPLRGTRAMALRYIANTDDLDLSRFTVLIAGAPNVDGAGQAGASLGFSCSDAADLLSGVPAAVVLPLPANAPGSDLQLFQVDTSVWGERVRIGTPPPPAAVAAST